MARTLSGKPERDKILFAFYSLSSLSDWVNVQVRVISRMSVSLVMSGGSGEKGAASLTIRTAAASRIRWPEDLSISTFSTLPSLLIETLSFRLPKTFCRRACSG